MKIDLKCCKCNNGFMRHTVLRVISRPIMFPHKCNNCGFEESYRKIYPYIEFENTKIETIIK
jgi:predicted Zn-ribbon and HTH transcriptional regulator